MILRALYEYYQRKSADPENADMAPAGWQWKEIPFVLVLDASGRLVTIDDYRDPSKGNSRARAFLVPQEVKRTVGVVSNMLWDKPSYIWGYDPEGKLERLRRQQQAFVEAILRLPQDDKGVQAALVWLSDPEEALAQAQAKPEWGDIAETASFIALRLDGDIDENGGPRLICRRPAVHAVLPLQPEKTGTDAKICLITGERAPVARLHASIKNVPGAQTSGAAIVSFNQRSFCSYGKTQGDNAPVSEAAADAYTKALNYLLRKDSPQKIQCGGTTTVFWARKGGEPLEGILAEILGGQEDKDDPDKRANAVRSLLTSPHNGGGAQLGADNMFYVLGLSPNAARLSVRFWLPIKVAILKEKLGDWFNQIQLIGGKTEYPPLRSLLSSLALGYKLDNLSLLLEGKMLESIFKGTPFPQTMLVTALRRMRAEQDLPHLRAALIKAALIRNHNRKDITMSLDPHNPDAAYQLGRLFSALEKTQEEAMPGINTTIRERYFSGASMRPATVFPVLHRLHMHHLKKIENRGRSVNLEKQVSEIVGKLSSTYPRMLNLEQQGAFAIGYYHQRQAFFTKAEKPEEQAA